LPGLGCLILHIYGKDLEIGEGVLPVKAVAAEVDVKFGAEWKPELSVTGWQADRTILDILVAQIKAIIYLTD
jgi:hypothetical protein